MKPNDLHLHIHNFLVMVQWADDRTTQVLGGDRQVLLTVSSRGDEPITTTTELRGESVGLNAEQRERVIQALQGNAPPCTCFVCNGEKRIEPGKVGALIATGPVKT